MLACKRCHCTLVSGCRNSAAETCRERQLHRRTWLASVPRPLCQAFARQEVVGLLRYCQPMFQVMIVCIGFDSLCFGMNQLEVNIFIVAARLCIPSFCTLPVTLADANQLGL